MRKLFFIAFCLMSVGVNAQTEITTEAQLKNISMTGNYILMNDIELSSSFIPIGDRSYSFQGTFDGNGHTITMSISYNQNNRYNYQRGLFSEISSTGVVRNLIVKGSVDNSPNGACYVGGIAGRNNGTITNCCSYVAINVSTYGNSSYNCCAGGIAGHNEGTISYCFSSSSIAGPQSNSGTGGIVGSSHYSVVQNCIFMGRLTNKKTGNAYGMICGESTSDDYTNVTDNYYLLNGDFTGLGVQYSGSVDDGGHCTALTATGIRNLAETGGVYASTENSVFKDAILANTAYISFADATVKTTCINLWDTNRDGNLSEAEAAAVKAIYTYFKNKTNIVSFNELQYFTGLSSIDANAFSGCSGLTSITIPSNVTSIGNEAFSGCTSLSSVVSEITTPFAFGSNAFSNIGSNCTLTVPAGTKAAYIAAGWTEEVFKGGVIENDNRPAQTLALTTIPAMTYGDAAYFLPQKTTEGLTLTWSVDNAAVASVSGNTLTIVGAGSATVTATQSGNDSYQPFSREFTLTVNKAMLTITADDKTKEEGEENPELTVTYSGFVNGDDVSSLTTQPTVTTTATTTSPAGTYPITVSGAVSGNYTFNYVNGTLTVTEKPAILVPTDISQMDNAIYIEPTAGLSGTTIDLCVKLKNLLIPVGCAFKLTLPEGLQLQKDEDGDVVYQLGSRAKKMSLTWQDWNNGTYDFALTPSTGTATISGSDDVIVTFKLPIPENMAAGDYALKLTKCLIQSKVDGTTTDYQLSDVVTTLTVEDYVTGDVNGDRKVTPSDAIMILYHYFDVEQTGFNVKAADVNGDGSVTPADAIEALYIYFNDGSQSNARQMQQTLDPQ